MIPRIVFYLMVAIALDHFVQPGHLKSWSNTHLKLAVSRPVPKEKECRSPTTQLDKLLVMQGEKCL